MSAHQQIVGPSQPAVGFPGQGIIADLAGRPVDTNVTVWRLNDATASVQLDWGRIPQISPTLLEACTAYTAELIKYQRPWSVKGWFHIFTRLANVEDFVIEGQAGGILGYKTFSTLFGTIGTKNRYLGHRLKLWYSWCCDQGYPHFDADTAFRLNEITYGGNEKARAVQSLDPADGPLSDVEVVSLLNALRASEATGSLNLIERVAVWLCIALGGNPHQYVLLRDGDLEQLDPLEGGDPAFQIRMPRMKKGHSQERAEFKVRKLIPELGQMVAELQDVSRQRYQYDFQGELGPGGKVPLFLRKRRKNRGVAAGLREYAVSMTSHEFTELVKTAVVKLGVRSPRTEMVLNVTCRRFRYTYATRLVREGASQRAVAEALDHSDLQNVQCYFDLKSDMVEKLDAAMAIALAPLAQAFLGHLVRGERDAVRGDQRASRIFHHQKAARKLEPVGTCGSFSFCGYAAPVACYTCVKFQPWIEAPHSQVLEDLLAEREQRAKDGLDGKIVGLLDTTILAVADVVSRIDAIHGAEVAPA